jgi:hypothetical protein
MPNTHGIPLHKQRGTSFHFHPHFVGKHALHWKECITFKGMQYSLCNLQKSTLGNQAWCFYVCDLSLFGCQSVYANAFVILFHSFATVVVVVVVDM